MDAKKDVIRETDAEAIRLAKTLIRTARHGALAALDPRTGAPLASRVGVATDLDGTPIILVSGLAAHTAAILADPRCSLLIGEPGKGDPLAHARITLACTAVKLERGTSEQQRAARRYLNRNPKAKLYAELGDFNHFRLEPQSASLNGGFGKAYALARADIITDSPANASLAEREQGAVDHMNDDHLDAIAVYAQAFGGASGGGWIITGLDAEGMDLAAGDEQRRVFFPAPIADAAGLRLILVEMAKAGRATLAEKA
jgi:putative heme iron utilization protein